VHGRSRDLIWNNNLNTFPEELKKDKKNLVMFVASSKVWVRNFLSRLPQLMDMCIIKFRS
jgi:hypothetical protein